MLPVDSWDIFYKDDWSLDDVTEYAAFIYLIEFPESGEHYYGVKQVWKGVKDMKKHRSTSKESNWKTYYSSSKSVQEKIDAGEPYTKKILWCYKSVQEAMLAESVLIGVFGTRHDNLNKAIMVKTRLKKDYGEQFSVLQRIIGDLI
jgi:hypothetical protein